MSSYVPLCVYEKNIHVYAYLFANEYM